MTLLGNDEQSRFDKYNLSTFQIESPPGTPVATTTGSNYFASGECAVNEYKEFKWPYQNPAGGSGESTFVLFTSGPCAGLYDLYDAVYPPERVGYTVCQLFGSSNCCSATVELMDGYSPVSGGQLEEKLYPVVGNQPDRQFTPGGQFKELRPELVLSGDAFVYIDDHHFKGGEACIAFVKFCLDSGCNGCQTERFTPYDLAGGSVATAKPLDTTTLANGEHVVSLEIKFKDECGGHSYEDTYPFQVDNN